MDSATLRDSAGLLVARQLFEPLVTIDPGSLEPREGAASWEMLDDATRFVFHIDRDRRFHNGIPVTADDAAFALNRLVRKETSSDYAYLLSEVGGFDEVHNRGTLSELTGISVIDERTLEIRLSTPWSGFPYVLSHPAASPISRSAFEADPTAYLMHPVGSGPYRLMKRFQTGNDFILEAVGSGGELPSIRRIEFHVYEQTLRAWADLGRGNVDVAEVPPAEIPSAKARYGEDGFAPLAGMIHLGFNLANPKFQDARFRRAVSLALDRVSISSSAYGGAMEPATGIMPSRLSGDASDRCGAACEFDPPRARSLVHEVFPEGAPEIFLDYPAGSVDQDFAELVRQYLAAVGVTVTLRPHEPTEFVEFVEASSQEMYRLGWAADYPSAEWFLYPLFGTGRPDNTVKYSSAEVDDLLNKARSSESTRQRLSLWKQAEERIFESMPVVPIGHFKSHLAASREIRGFRVDMLGTFRVAEMRVGHE